MAAASPVDVAVNPNNVEQRYILWGNGRIDAIGGAPPVTNQKTWYTRFEPPGVALHITNWTTGSGYVLDYRGGFNPFGSAPELGTTASDGPSAGVPAVSGIPVTGSPQARRYVDWSWDPAGTGQGYVLDQWGEILPFGGATAPPRTGRRFTWGAARKLVMSWTPSKRGIQMDMYGGLRPEFAQPAITDQGAYWLGHDYARDLVVTNWTTLAGYKLNLYGGVHAFGAAEPAYGMPQRVGADVARTLAVLSPDNPLKLWIVWSGAQSFDVVSSTPPAVVAGGTDPQSPEATVTDTTRPVLSWTYADSQKDSQAAWQLYVYTQAWVNGHSMTNPATWAANALVAEDGINRTTRGITSPVDFSNGTYRMYVRAKDTADQWSAWSNYGWTQDVPVPAAPTGLTATANEATFSVALSVAAPTGGVANLVRFEFSDDGSTWATVRGAGAVTLAATTTATDDTIPLGVTRTYRAVAYATNPATASLPSGTATAQVSTLTHVLTVPGFPALGGKVSVQDPVEWSRAVSAGVFQGLGADYPTVVSDGRPKSRRTTLHLVSLDAAAWARIEALVEADAVLLYRDPLGSAMYCRVVGDWSRAKYRGAPTQHLHTTGLPLVEVAPPISDI